MRFANQISTLAKRLDHATAHSTAETTGTTTSERFTRKMKRAGSAAALSALSVRARPWMSPSNVRLPISQYCRRASDWSADGARDFPSHHVVGIFEAAVSARLLDRHPPRADHHEDDLCAVDVRGKDRAPVLAPLDFRFVKEQVEVREPAFEMLDQELGAREAIVVPVADEHARHSAR